METTSIKNPAIEDGNRWSDPYKMVPLDASHVILQYDNYSKSVDRGKNFKTGKR